MSARLNAEHASTEEAAAAARPRHEQARPVAQAGKEK